MTPFNSQCQMKFTTLFLISARNVKVFMKNLNVQQFVLLIVVFLIQIEWSQKINSWLEKQNFIFNYD